MSSARHPKGRLSYIEAAALMILTALLTINGYRAYLQPHFFFSSAGMRDLHILKPYGLSNRVSRNFEELIIREFFQDKRGGTFLDVGANHYRNENNTYYLETALGWSGVAVDALKEYADGYRQHRPKTQFVAMFAADRDHGTVQFFVPAQDNMASSYRAEHTLRDGQPGATRDVPTATLTTLLEQAGVTRLDFLSMDIELAEPKALAGFNVERFRPALVCIESHPKVRQQILDYFAAHHYVLVGRYLRLDPHNLYFMPRQSD